MDHQKAGRYAVHHTVPGYNPVVSPAIHNLLIGFITVQPSLLSGTLMPPCNCPVAIRTAGGCQGRTRSKFGWVRVRTRTARTSQIRICTYPTGYPAYPNQFSSVQFCTYPTYPTYPAYPVARYSRPHTVKDVRSKCHGAFLFGGCTCHPKHVAAVEPVAHDPGARFGHRLPVARQRSTYT